MRGLRFSARVTSLLGVADSAYLDDGDTLNVNLANGVLSALDLNIEVEVAGVTAPLAYWRDPDHWSTDWAEKLGCDSDEADDRVYAILESAVES